MKKLLPFIAVICTTFLLGLVLGLRDAPKIATPISFLLAYVSCCWAGYELAKNDKNNNI
jgi:hypothetical protein